MLPSELKIAVNPPPTSRSIAPKWITTIPNFFIFQILLLKKENDRFISITISVNRPPGVGKKENHIIQEEK